MPWEWNIFRKKQENCIYFCKKFTTVFCNIWLVWGVFLACTIWILYNYNTMICGDIWELFAIELNFIVEISTISNEFKLFCCQTESNSNIGPLFWVLRARLSTPIFLSNIFPLKMSKETYFHKKTISFYFFLNSRKCTKTMEFVWL